MLHDRLDWDFDQWRELQAVKRADRRRELETALRAGLAIYHFGAFWTTAGIARGPSFGLDARGYTAFIEPFGSDPAYLAEHIECREYGLGFETWIVRGCGHATT